MEGIMFYVPLGIGVLGNILYNVFAKSTPDDADTFASLTLTYAAGMAATFVIYMVTSGGGNIFAEFAKANWASYALGLCIVGCDVAIILLYRVGWDISVGTLVGNISVSLALVVVGVLLWNESLDAMKIAGQQVPPTPPYAFFCKEPANRRKTGLTGSLMCYGSNGRSGCEAAGAAARRQRG